MIRETMIDAERGGSDEAHEWHDIKLLNVLMECIEEEGNLFDDDNRDCVCLCDPIDFNAGT